MKHTVFLVLCMALLVEVYTKGGKGGKGGGGGFFSKSGGKTSSPKSNPKATVHSKPQKPVTSVKGRGWETNYPSLHTPKKYPNWNPNNQIMSPRYGGNYAYGAYGHGRAQGGSQFAQSVQSRGYQPNAQSKGFGRQGAMAVGAGAMGGMALGYGLGSFPRSNVQFQSPHQEYYYNHYMYQHYGSQDSHSTNQRTHFSGGSSSGSQNRHGSSGSSSSSSSDKNNYGDNDKPPPVLLEPETYDGFMRSCMKRSDLPRAECMANQTQPQDKTKAGMPSTTPVPNNSTKLSNGTTKGEGKENETMMKGAEKKEDNDEVVSIVDIGYPALIEQLRSRQCLELYMNQEARKQEQNAYGHGVKMLPMDLIGRSLLCLIGFLLLY